MRFFSFFIYVENSKQLNWLNIFFQFYQQAHPGKHIQYDCYICYKQPKFSHNLNHDFLSSWYGQMGAHHRMQAIQTHLNIWWMMRIRVCCRLHICILHFRKSSNICLNKPTQSIYDKLLGTGRDSELIWVSLINRDFLTFLSLFLCFYVYKINI